LSAGCRNVFAFGVFPAEIPVSANGKLIYIKKYAIKHIFEGFFVRGNEQRLYFCVVLDETREKEKV